jgi:Uma2 family endonuclease
MPRTRASAVTKTAKLTLEAFLRMPETKPAREYEDGEVTKKTMPSTWHSIVQQLLAVVFGFYLRERPIGQAGPELRCIFGPPGRVRGYVPDYVVIVGAPPGFGPINGPWRGAPDLAVEILSPDDRMTRVNRKVRFYLENGVRLVWLIDPDNRIVTVMTTADKSITLSEEDELDGGDVLPGFRVPVRDILPPVQPPAS